MLHRHNTKRLSPRHYYLPKNLEINTLPERHTFPSLRNLRGQYFEDDEIQHETT